MTSSELDTRSGAAYVRGDWERWLPEPAKSPRRTPFERDRARVVHSSALRRLGAKTQVLGPGTDDFVRTRLTHSLEVAQVGRELGKLLGCDPDVVDTACLAHDLGHPPFGHNGETALADAADGAGGFEGNAQTFRILTRLEPKTFTPDGVGVGLNLTRASLDAATKYPWRRGDGPLRRDGRPNRKFGVYDDDLELYAWMREGAPHGERCLEAQVMDLADDISYSVHDVEDAIVGGRVDPARLRSPHEQDRIVAQARDWYDPEVSDDELHTALTTLLGAPFWVDAYDGSRRSLAAIKDMTSQLIGRFAGAAVDATREAYGWGRLTRYSASLQVPGATTAEIAVLKGVAALYVMAPREHEPLYTYQRRVLTDLVEVLLERAELALEEHFLVDYRRADDDAGRLRVVVDQVSSLTDVSAMAWHARLCRPPD
ncbi:deoxyguanosinetriphosphate triphosphohydrolase [Beutenbergia cavernae DSM 12333]|uniref:Deoxyguanosinetriphosphate triphosphohydrolase-like protein n=1 Tax=Beutenbergia cavernae (strain ATCC BAA-8 / DSM 12333 / CCUG 43141 / JCM 11478 / NBRC 16432 / NCIMB 13614 / HKI 0122) TaxID=471853 RepID=C5C4R4_BEUC1|nr:deoxyguanosinetriphosphate triphosphohydrolase [Beutenbergia cavernae]ACQ80042.1 deoxyguanosinetriphosphate triphosphohydrolase [Beutenbergia cavernae DSM 12333]